RELSGENAHHVLEASFKAAGRSLRQAVSIDPDFYDDIPSTKGILS
ncbi:MAG: imidazoleglycerol-phosphate dehydratase, partial [Clostridia bacterium]|nr:imidazoleglycerol-phosphate dehydratase [Clostridia bacterium]